MLPSSQQMKDNLEFYREQDIDEKWFRPRPEAVNYVLRDNDEEGLLTFIEKNFIFSTEQSNEVNLQVVKNILRTSHGPYLQCKCCDITLIVLKEKFI